MQDFGSTTMQNPFESYSSTLNRKRDAEESGMDMQSQETVVAQQQQGHAVMPLPKRRIVSLSSKLSSSFKADECVASSHLIIIHTNYTFMKHHTADRRQCTHYGFTQWQQHHSAL